MKKEVSIKEIRELAESLYGPLYCSEAIVSAIRTKFELDVPEHVVAMASGFPVGIGGSLCLCEAVSGGIMSLGLFFGRSQPDDPSIDKMMQLAKEMHDWFKHAAGKNALCCRVLVKGLEMGSKGHFDQCTYLTGLVAEKTAQMLVCELALVNLDDQRV